MIGGSGEKKTLRLVAKYGSACNLFTREGVDGVRHKLDVLRGHCDAENRDYASIEKTILHSASIPTGDAVDAFIDDMGHYAEICIDTVIVMPFGDQPVELVGGLAPIVERLASL